MFLNPHPLQSVFFKNTTHSTGLSTHRMMKNGWVLVSLNKLRTEHTIVREAFMKSGRGREGRKEEIIIDDSADFTCSLWEN